MSEALLDHATHTMAAGSKSFASASKLFDPETRRAALMLYAWCRHCDDVIDDQTLGFNNALQGNEAQKAASETRLIELKAQTERAFAGKPMSEPAFAAFAAFQEVALTHEIPPRQAFDHLEGYAMDVRDEHYQTIDDTLRYCYHVAGVVGLMMARVMGVRDEAVLDRACDLGLAFQLTNIARDIVEDARAGRCYVPAEWLHDEGMTAKDILDPTFREALARVATRLIETAEPYYASARVGLQALPLRSAWAIAAALGVYRKIGVKVTRAGGHAWDGRQSTGRGEKIALLLSGGASALGSRARKAASLRPTSLWQRPR
ncbi:15-cis-phytoene synthase CrtB [Vreelandella sp. EE22]